MEVEEEPKSKSKSLAKSTCPVALTAVYTRYLPLSSYSYMLHISTIEQAA